MRKSRYTEEQIVGILKESEAGLETAELCRKHGISEQTFYRWKAKYGGMEVSDAQRWRQLEEENRKLKQLVAEQQRASGPLPSRTQVMRVYGGDYIEQSGYHDKVSTPISCGHLRWVFAETKDASREVKKAATQFTHQIQQVQYVVPARVHFALHGQPQRKHRHDCAGKQCSSAPPAQKQVSGARNQPSGYERQIHETSMHSELLIR